MPDYKIDPVSGFMIFPVTVKNKHDVKFNVNAKIDTGALMGKISYRIFSALGLETQLPVKNDSKYDALDVAAHVWVNIDFKTKDFGFEGDFIIKELDKNIDLTIGMLLIRQYFKISIDSEKQSFEIKPIIK